jgi:hypothetical protein
MWSGEHGGVRDTFALYSRNEIERYHLPRESTMRTPDAQHDVSCHAGAMDRSSAEHAGALFTLWYETRCQSLPALVRMQRLMLRAYETSTLGAAALDLGAGEAGPADRLDWATLIGQLTLCVTSAPPVSAADHQAVVARLRDAWELAARLEPPVWANENAEMPRLSRLSPTLATDAGFVSLTPAAQIIAMQTAAWGEGRAVVGPWTLLAAHNNLHLVDARRAVAELENAGWAICGEHGFSATTNDGFYAVRISARALCQAVYASASM